MDSDLRYGRAVRAAEMSQRAPAARSRCARRSRCPACPTRRATWRCRWLVRERLVGVLALESRNAAGFASWHEAFLGIVADQVAAGIERLAAADVEEPAAGRRRAARRGRRRAHAAGRSSSTRTTTACSSTAST